MVENEGSHNYQRAENTPAPEIACPEGVRYSAIVKFVAHARADAAPPNKGVDAQCEPRKDEENQAEVHGMPVVVPAGDGVYLRRDVRKHHNLVYAQSQYRKNDVFEQSPVGAEIACRRNALRVIAWRIGGIGGSAGGIRRHWRGCRCRSVYKASQLGQSVGGYPCLQAVSPYQSVGHQIHAADIFQRVRPESVNAVTIIICV